MSDNSENLLTREQLAARLQVTPRHVHNLEKRMGLQPIRLGGCVRYDWNEVLIHVKAHRGQLRGHRRRLRDDKPPEG